AGVATSLRNNTLGTLFKEMYFSHDPISTIPGAQWDRPYIQQLIKSDFENISLILEPPEGQDLGVWKYEHLRQFCLQLNDLAVILQVDCFPDVCTQMTATEQWIFLCAAHKTPKECPALDYTRHTLDGAASLLNSNKYFPSRIICNLTANLNRYSTWSRNFYRLHYMHTYHFHKSICNPLVKYQFDHENIRCFKFSFTCRHELYAKYDHQSLDDKLHKLRLTCPTSHGTNSTKAMAYEEQTKTQNRQGHCILLLIEVLNPRCILARSLRIQLERNTM
ncbi:Hypothetical predicted protein, partial [Paramuricea clavata]